MIYPGLRTMSKPYLGTKEVKRIYLGETLLYSDMVRITYTLDGVTCNGASQVDGGASFSATLSGATGKQVDPLSVVVMMGTTDITDSAYDWTNNTISIASVTDAVSITAVGITMDSAYKPLPYIAAVTAVAADGINLGFKVTHNTKIYAELVYDGNSPTYLLSEYRVSRTGTHYCTFYEYGSKNYFAWNTSSVNWTPCAPTGVKRYLTIDKGVLTYTWDGANTTYTKDLSGNVEFTSSANLCLFGNTNNPASGVALGKIIKLEVYEDGTLTHNFRAAYDISNNKAVLLDVTTNTAKSNAKVSTSPYVGPYISISDTFANCTASLLSDANSGTIAHAVIGSTWSVKLTPDSGYTFVGGSCAVTLNGETSTLAAATYDSGTDTYTVTINGVPFDKTIAITATAVAS